MKKLLLGLFLLTAVPTLKGQSIDEKVFLEPHVSSLAGKVAFQGGSELALNKRESYEYALSLNCGVHLPPTTQFVSQHKAKMIGLGVHLCDIAESLKTNGKAIITAPASYDVVFTTGKKSNEEIQKDIAVVLEKIGTSQDHTHITALLNELKEISHATFVKRNGKLKLVTDAKELSIGEEVWRKNPQGAQTEVYHSEEEHLVAIKSAGLVCEEIKRPCFFGEVKWKNYNATATEEEMLGSAYMNHHPFTIYIVRKA